MRDIGIVLVTGLVILGFLGAAIIDNWNRAQVEIECIKAGRSISVVTGRCS